MNRDFKGVWIPKEIWLNKELSFLEKVILIEIDSLDNENHCTASNEYFAEFCGCSLSAVTKAITKLKKLEYIEQVEFNGRRRILRSRLVNFTRQDSKIYEADSENLLPINIYNNQSNNIENKVFISKDINTTKPRTSRYTQWMVLINERSEDESVRKLLTEWLEMVLEKYKDTGKQLYKNVLKGKLKMLDEIPAEDWKESIGYSIQKGYEGFYPVKKRNERRSDNIQSNRPDAEYDKREEAWRKEMERNGKKIKF